MTDGLLMRLRDTYPLETAWAPPWVGDELRKVRTCARDSHLASLRATAEATAARRDGENEKGSEQQALALSYQAMRDIYREHEAVLTTAMADRVDWERATRHQRQLAAAADAELRRRHPEQRWPPLRSAEPQLADEVQAESPNIASAPDTEELAQRVKDLAARHRQFAEKLADRQSLMIPAEDPDFEHGGPAFPTWTTPRRDAILQPPKPQIYPSERILERVAGQVLDMEAGS
jgi:hypothetical protein